ncbi:MAG: NAD-dependent epimerase/dehydratase family protein [Planctomycetaceae bacterium]|nr:NAD-dependent epimerase/dehydratase family protein [Planctomycetaceae bacterium]
MGMKLLVLGGTRFVGRHTVEAALARGHDVTLFHRGKSGPELFPECEHVLGDRRIGLEALGAQEFDACLDTSGYRPSEVRRSAEFLESRVGRYAFVSTISVHAHPERSGADETAELAPWDPTQGEELNEASYGPLKAACERIVQASFGERALVLRPGLLVGPHDPTDRFSWWVARLASGGPVLAPGPAGARVQWLDARDLGRFTVQLLEDGARGVYTAAGPAEPTTLGELLGSLLNYGGGDGELIWADPGFLLDEGVKPFRDLPLWIPEDGPRGLFSVDPSRALAAGLNPRPLVHTLGDTHRWLGSRGPGQPWQAGISPSRERELLDRWQAQSAHSPFALPSGREL